MIKLQFFFNGDYAVFLSVDNIENENSLKSTIKVQDGFYQCFYEDGTVQTLNLGPLL